MTTVLEAHNISHNFRKDGQSLQVLEDINLEINQGEFVCLIGPSGSGKSTLLRILLGLMRPSEGKVRRPKKFQQAMVFQNFALFPWLDVSQNVGFGLKMAGAPESESAQTIQHNIKQMGLHGFEHNHPKELSGGMKQRVGIARALAMDPQVLFMDEPFSALDAITARKLRQETLEVWRKTKMTVVMVTHLVEEAIELADRVIVFSSQPGRVQNVIKVNLSRPRNRSSQEFYKLVDKLERLIDTSIV